MKQFGDLNNSRNGYHSDADFEAVIIAQGYLCFYCGIPVCHDSADPDCEVTKDHLLAESRGGVDFIWNIVAACLRCNRLKGTMLPAQFLRRLYPFAHPVNGKPEISTGESLLGENDSQGVTFIPLHKSRPHSYPELYDDRGNFIEDHIATSQMAAGFVNNLARQKQFGPLDEKEYAKRQRLLQEQAHFLMRQSLERCGQLTLKLDMPKPPSRADLLTGAPTEAQSLAVSKGLTVVERKA
jgi:hypothetical protein